MPGFDTDSTGGGGVLFATNVDFTGSSFTAGSPQVTTDGQLLIGSTVTPRIRVGSLGSSDGSITWSVGNGTITGQVAGGSTVGKTITGNSGGPISPSAGNWNLLGSGSTTVTGAGNTLTIAVSGGGMPFSDKAVTFSALSNNGYFCTAALTVNLPGAPSQGDKIIVDCDTAGAVVVTAAGGQRIRIGASQSAVAGNLTSTAIGNALTLYFRSADTTWQSVASQGNWTVN